MDEAVTRVLAQYEQRIEAEDALMASHPPGSLMARRDEFLLSVGSDTGRILNILAKGARAKSVLELGTSYGYSTVWLAEAARETGGHVHSLELAAHKSEFAGQALARAGLADYVTLHVGHALETLPTLSGPFDLVLIDLWKELYVPCLELIVPKLAPGAYVVADNMILPETWHAEVAVYRQRIAQMDFDSVLLPIGSGIELSRWR